MTIATINAISEWPQSKTPDGRYHLAKPVRGPLVSELRSRLRTAWFALMGRGVLVLYADQIPQSPEANP